MQGSNKSTFKHSVTKNLVENTVRIKVNGKTLNRNYSDFALIKFQFPKTFSERLRSMLLQIFDTVKFGLNLRKKNNRVKSFLKSLRLFYRYIKYFLD